MTKRTHDDGCKWVVGPEHRCTCGLGTGSMPPDDDIDRQIDRLHGPGAAAALDEALKSGWFGW